MDSEHDGALSRCSVAATQRKTRQVPKMNGTIVTQN